MSTVWREKTAAEGIPTAVLLVNELAPDGRGALLLNPGGKPDWVKDPITGNPVRVLGMFLLREPQMCGQCSRPLPIGTVALAAKCDGDDEHIWYVYVCPIEHVYVWEKRSHGS